MTGYKFDMVYIILIILHVVTVVALFAIPTLWLVYIFSAYLGFTFDSRVIVIKKFLAK